MTGPALPPADLTVPLPAFDERDRARYIARAQTDGGKTADFHLTASVQIGEPIWYDPSGGMTPERYTVTSVRAVPVASPSAVDTPRETP